MRIPLAAGGDAWRRWRAASGLLTANTRSVVIKPWLAKMLRHAREIGKHAHDVAPMWTASFIRPRTSIITSEFGSGRLFNGRLTTRHLGVDFRGALGEPVRAANRGVVALVDNLFLAGNVVYIDHGAEWSPRTPI